MGQTIVRKCPVFVAVDGEGVTDPETNDHIYILMGSSSGRSIYRAAGISTKTALEFLLAEKRNHKLAIFVSFAFTYDVNMILKDLPREDLETLWKTGKVQWKSSTRLAYWLEWRPHKSLSIYSAGRRVRIYDVWGFYQSSFVTALHAWNVGTVEQRTRIEEMKKERGEFVRENLSDIRRYCLEECELLSVLCVRLWHAFDQADIIPRDWHGPGAVAATVLRQRIKRYYTNEDGYPDGLRNAIRCAYFGGRVEIFKQGFIGTAINYDIRSAYPYAATFLPTLKGGEWRQESAYDETQDYALWFVGWKLDRLTNRYGPFPYRFKGDIYWPSNGRGWYHSAEVAAAIQAGFPLDIRGGYSFAPREETRPFEFVPEYYAARERAKRNGDAAEKAYKLALNSLYGKLAQGYGYDNKPPPFQSYYWAGFITSYTRARMLKLLMEGREFDPIYIATDSICFAGNRDLPESTNLGGLERGIWRDLFVIQNGIYHGQNGSGEYARSRGFFLRDLDFDVIRAEWQRAGFLGAYENESHRFIGLGTALQRTEFDIWRRWIEVPKRLSFSVRPKKWYAQNEPSETGVEILFPPMVNPHEMSEPYVPKRARMDGSAPDWTAGIEQPDIF